MATVLFCSDDPILSAELRRILKNVPGLDLLDCSGFEILRKQLESRQPDILLLDINEDIAYAALNDVRLAVCSSRIVLWAQAFSTELVSQSLSLRIRGILRKDLPADTLIRCLLRVSEGELWFDKALSDIMLTSRSYSLTRREGQLVAQLSQGLKNREIATALNITEGTVKVYMSRLFRKLGVKDRLELALYGLRSQVPPGQPPRPFLVARMPAASQPVP